MDGRNEEVDFNPGFKFGKEVGSYIEGGRQSSENGLIHININC